MTSFFAAICISLACIYVLLMLLYRSGWNRQPLFTLPPDMFPRTRISVIIPARNEAACIEACIRSLMAQDYPSSLLEFIVIDDHSTDNTAEIAERMGCPELTCIRLADHKDTLPEGFSAYKKRALAAGIASSSGSLIVTTDADCIAPPGWLRHIAAAYESTGAVMIAGPVDYFSVNSLLGVFQSLDFMAMQGITAAAHHYNLGSMSNGANLAFSREAYEQVGGYKGIDHLASGDDFLLTHKMREAFPGRVIYLKAPGAIVRTAPQPDWKSFLNQRVRWASKSGKYNDSRLTAILIPVYLFNLCWTAALLTGIFFPPMLYLPALMLLIKLIPELFFMYGVAGFFSKRNQLMLFPLLQPVHIFYIVVAGFLGMAGGYSWKERRIKL